MKLISSRECLLAIFCCAAALISAPSFSLAETNEFGACDNSTNAPAAVESALDDVLKKLQEPSLGLAPGGVLSVRAEGWVYEKSLGLADLEAGVPIDCDMPFQIGSNTKMMTATVLLQLQEEGRLSIDDRLADHLPEVAARLPNGEVITLRQLAQHTSGVFSYTDTAPDGTPGLMDADIDDPAALRRQIGPGDMIDFVVEHGQPNFVPGEEGAWSYSNTGYTLLGMVIEKLEAKPIEKSFEIRIFEPLGMNDTYMWNGIPRPEFGLPRAYLAAPFTNETTEWNMSQGWAAGAVVSTIEDMHTFIQALLAGQLFQSPDTLSLMKQTVSTTHTALLGYGIGLARKGKGLWGHGGQTLGYLSEVAALEDGKLSIVAWGTSSSNVFSIGALLISRALGASGGLPE